MSIIIIISYYYKIKLYDKTVVLFLYLLYGELGGTLYLKTKSKFFLNLNMFKV